jgi:voltage-gated potassium channel
MLPGFLARAAQVLLGHEGRSPHLKAARGATLVLLLVMSAGI